MKPPVRAARERPFGGLELYGCYEGTAFEHCPCEGAAGFERGVKVVRGVRRNHVGSGASDAPVSQHGTWITNMCQERKESFTKRRRSHFTCGVYKRERTRRRGFRHKAASTC